MLAFTGVVSFYHPSAALCRGGEELEHTGMVYLHITEITSLARPLMCLRHGCFRLAAQYTA